MEDAKRPQCNGKVALLGAVRLGIDAAASFPGTLMGQHLDEVDKVTCPASFHYGHSAPVVSLDEVDAIKKAFAGRSNADIQVYKGAGHNFAMPRKEGYSPAAATESRERVLRCVKSV